LDDNVPVRMARREVVERGGLRQAHPLEAIIAGMADQADSGSHERTPNTGALSFGEGEAKIRITIREFQKLFWTLAEDVDRAFLDADEAANAGQDKESRRARRNAARALFAWIEATVWSIKQTALQFENVLPEKTFNVGEIAVLREREFRLDEDGKVKERNKQLRAEPNLRFAFEAFGRPVHSDFELQAHGPEWAAYLRALKIRDRLMHPKEASQLKVSDEEYAVDLVGTRRWLIVSFRRRSPA
jgi:hypothetical protein